MTARRLTLALPVVVILAVLPLVLGLTVLSEKVDGRGRVYRIKAKS